MRRTGYTPQCALNSFVELFTKRDPVIFRLLYVFGNDHKKEDYSEPEF